MDPPCPEEPRHEERTHIVNGDALDLVPKVGERLHHGDGHIDFPGGRAADGVGYFPSLAALQFQSSIPGPSPSLAEFENREKERLNRILKGIGYLVLAYFLIS